MLKGYKGKNFKNKLFYSFMVIGILPLLVMAAIFYYNMTVFTSNKIDNYVMETLDIGARLIDSTVTTFANMTNYISENGDVQAILKKDGYRSYEERFEDTQQLYKTTRSVLATQTLDVPMHVIDRKRLSRFSTTDYHVPIYEDSRGNFYDIIDKSEGKQLSFIHRRVDGKDSKDIVMAVGRQIRDPESGEFLGYVISDVYDQYFDSIVENSKIYKENNVYVLDRNGTIITDKLFKNRTGFKFDEKYFTYISNQDSGKFKCIIDGEASIAYFTTSEHTGLKLVELVPTKVIYRERAFIIPIFILLVIILSLIAILSAYGMSESISRPVRVLSSLMKKVESGDRNVNFTVDTNDEIGHLGKSFNDMVKEINRLIEEVYMKQYLLQQSEYKALKAQVNPHFLYNTLQSIDWMARLGDNQGVSTMVTALGKFLRYSVSKQGDIVTVRQEVEQIENYLVIQKTRYKDKFDVEVVIDEKIINSKTLRLLLQPIVENSIVHGLEPKVGKGKLVIRGYSQQNIIILEVIDDGVGVSSCVSKGEGIGMENVDKRIKIHYGEEYGVVLSSGNGVTCASIRIPDEK
jgi:two-component system, sensor histidine kinase YesM